MWLFTMIIWAHLQQFGNLEPMCSFSNLNVFILHRPNLHSYRIKVE